MSKDLPSPEELRNLLRYDPVTGKLFWRPRPMKYFPSERTWKIWNKQHPNKEALRSKDKYGYAHGSLLGFSVRAHRVAWAVHMGTWPSGVIDHINGNPLDNRICNLRDVTKSENAKNAIQRKDNKSGCTGVFWKKTSKVWVAKISTDGKVIYLGRFAEYGDAVKARKKAERRYGYTKRHGQS